MLQEVLDDDAMCPCQMLRYIPCLISDKEWSFVEYDWAQVLELHLVDCFDLGKLFSVVLLKPFVIDIREAKIRKLATRTSTQSWQRELLHRQARLAWARELLKTRTGGHHSSTLPDFESQLRWTKILLIGLIRCRFLAHHWRLGPLSISNLLRQVSYMFFRFVRVSKRRMHWVPFRPICSLPHFELLDWDELLHGFLLLFWRLFANFHIWSSEIGLLVYWLLRERVSISSLRSEFLCEDGCRSFLHVLVWFGLCQFPHRWTLFSRGLFLFRALYRRWPLLRLCSELLALGGFMPSDRLFFRNRF